MMTTTARPGEISPDSMTPRQRAADYERMLAGGRRAMVPTFFGSLPKRSPRGQVPEDERTRSGGGLQYNHFNLPQPRPSWWDQLIKWPPLLPACVTTILAPPYLFGSEERTETGPTIGPVAYSVGHKEDGSVELMAQLLGSDTSAELYDNLYRGRIVAGYLLAGVYTVPQSSGAAEVRISAHVEARGTSLIYTPSAPGPLVLIQLGARMDILRLGGDMTRKSKDLHQHTWLEQPIRIAKEIDKDETLSAVVPVAEGDELAIFLSAEARLFVQDGEDFIAVVNVSADESVINGGSVHFPYVQLRLC